MRTSYSAEQKQQVMTYLDNGLSVKETSEKTGVKPQTITNWKVEKKKANGGAEPKKRAKKAKEPERSLEQQLHDADVTLRLKELEIEALRRLVEVKDPVMRAVIEIEYLRDCCRVWGYTSVKPLLQAEQKKEPTPD